MSFRYADAQVRLLDLVDEPHPTRWDLCTFHADALQVPRGWERIDERAAAEFATRTATRVRQQDPDARHSGEEARAAAGPEANDRHPTPEISTAAETGPAGPVDAPAAPPRPRSNRYEALSARLPQLAAGHHRPRGREPATAPAEPSGADPADDRPPSTSGRSTPGRSTSGSRSTAVRPSDGRSGTDLHRDDRVDDGPVVENVPGQLVMPVGDAVASHEVGLGDSGFGDEAVGHRDNVVPLVRRELLDPVT